MDYFKIIPFTVICCLLCSTYTSATETQRVTILVDDSYPPYSYVENGELKGVYIDIVRASSKLLSSRYHVKLVAVPWKRGLSEVKEGRAFAILPPYKHIEERSYMWPYSLSIMTENVVAFCHKDIKLQEYIRQPSKTTITPLNIGINAGYLILNQYLQQAVKLNNVVIQENKSTSANIMKLYLGRIDCYLNDRFSTQWELSKLRQKRDINFDNIKEALLVMSQTAHIGYTDNENHEFYFKSDFVLRMDEALSTLMSSDKYQEIIDRYK
jgi:polar amino acid transport system substrate-binding protein